MKKNLKNQPHITIPEDAECSFSFWDLYKAVFGKDASEDFKKEFSSYTQEEKNVLVKKWAEQVHWTIDDRIGSDGVTYTAFYNSKSPTQ
jgi:hypothetical protein